MSSLASVHLFIDQLSWRSLAQSKLDICRNISRRRIFPHLVHCHWQSSSLPSWHNSCWLSRCRKDVSRIGRNLFRRQLTNQFLMRSRQALAPMQPSRLENDFAYLLPARGGCDHVTCAGTWRINFQWGPSRPSWSGAQIFFSTKTPCSSISIQHCCSLSFRCPQFLVSRGMILHIQQLWQTVANP